MIRQTTAKLLKARAGGMRVVVSSQPFAGREVAYDPRNKYDSRPWTLDGYRFSAGELQPTGALRFTVEDRSGWSIVRDTVTGMDVTQGDRTACERDADDLNNGWLSLDSFGRIKR